MLVEIGISVMAVKGGVIAIALVSQSLPNYMQLLTQSLTHSPHMLPSLALLERKIEIKGKFFHTHSE